MRGHPRHPRLNRPQSSQTMTKNQRFVVIMSTNLTHLLRLWQICWIRTWWQSSHQMPMVPVEHADQWIVLSQYRSLWRDPTLHIFDLTDVSCHREMICLLSSFQQGFELCTWTVLSNHEICWEVFWNFWTLINKELDRFETWHQCWYWIILLSSPQGNFRCFTCIGI